MKDAKADLELQVRLFVSKETHWPVESVVRSATFSSLGIDGDDAIELLEKYCKVFKVNMRDVDLSTYIGAEGLLGLVSMIKKMQHKMKNVSVDLLIRSAEKGIWD